MRGKMSGGKISGPERYVRRMLREIADMIEAERRGNAMKFSTLNLIDDHRRLHLQHSAVEPTLVCVLLLVQDRPVASAHADVQRCRFSVSSDGPLFWVGEGTNFSITEQERREIERFLWRNDE